MYSIIFLTVTSFIGCLCLTPLVRIVSRSCGVMDHPNARKRHTSPVPRTGGVAIAGAYVAAVGALLLSPLRGASAVDLPVVVQLLPAATLVFAVGLVDDFIGLKAWQKLLGQVAAALFAYWHGVQVLGIAGFSMHGLWSLPLTVLWLVACCNAFNLIDGVDGLATGVGLFATFTTLAAALVNNNAPLALATAPLVGALLAFLRYNFNPASIFLGDSGSLTIGFVLGCFGAIWSQKSATLLGMTAPLMALSVPLLDAAIAVVRRFIRRQPIFSADRNHVHHRLLDRGLSPRRVAVLLYGACGLAAAFSILQTMPGNKFHGLLLIVFCGVAWLGVQFVSYAEFDVARSLVLSGTFRHIVSAKLFVEELERKLGAAATPDDYWLAMRDVSHELGFPYVRMSLGDTVYEHRTGTKEPDHCCTIRIPLSDTAYVNFRYPVSASVRNAVAIAPVVAILQRSMPRAGALATAELMDSQQKSPVAHALAVGELVSDSRPRHGRRLETATGPAQP